MNLKIKGFQLKNDNNDYKIINISRCTVLVSKENIGEYLLNFEIEKDFFNNTQKILRI